MTTKLTLSIDEEVIRKAKLASLKRGKSLSKVVEEYLQIMSSKEFEKESTVKKISGALKQGIKGDTDVKKVKKTYLKQKYGI